MIYYTIKKKNDPTNRKINIYIFDICWERKDYENKATKTDSPYWEVGKDGMHPGAKWHLGLANYIFDNLKNEK